MYNYELKEIIGEVFVYEPKDMKIHTKYKTINKKKIK